MFEKTIPPEAQRHAESAKGWTLAALILYGVFGALFLLMWAVVPAILLFILGMIPLFFLFLVYATVYRPLSVGKVREARSPALALGIVSIFVGGVLSAIFLIIAYLKANRAYTSILLAESAVPAHVQTPGSTVPEWVSPTSPKRIDVTPSGSRTPEYCASCGTRLAPPYRFCTSCGSRIQ